jgi:hypothetical protein
LHPYLPSAKEAHNITCTGASFDPAQEDLVQAFHSIWTTPALLLHKAQTAMKSQIVEAFDISIFPTQNTIFLDLTFSKNYGNIFSVKFIATAHSFSNMLSNCSLHPLPLLMIFTQPFSSSKLSRRVKTF